MMDLKLEGQVAIVTGGSEGIGKELLYGGPKVAICARHEDVLHRTRRNIQDPI